MGITVPLRPADAGPAPSRRRGKEAALEAIDTAARQLFSERGPAAVSLREVAAHAGVSYGLIHHYVGTREALVQRVFRASSQRAAAELAGAGNVTQALAILRRQGEGSVEYTRMLAFSLLEGRDPAVFQGPSPALEAIVALAGDSPGLDDDSGKALRTALAAAMVSTLGWKLFGAYVAAAAGLDQATSEQLAADLTALTEGWVGQALEAQPEQKMPT